MKYSIKPSTQSEPCSCTTITRCCHCRCCCCHCCLYFNYLQILQVGEETKPNLIHCKCNHLTSFASDFLVAPNPIDFDKVFSADLSKNFVVLLVVCLLFGLYLVLIVIARRFDKKDQEKVRYSVYCTFLFLVSQNRGT